MKKNKQPRVDKGRKRLCVDSAQSALDQLGKVRARNLILTSVSSGLGYGPTEAEHVLLINRLLNTPLYERSDGVWISALDRARAMTLAWPDKYLPLELMELIFSLITDPPTRRSFSQISKEMCALYRKNIRCLQVTIRPTHLKPKPLIVTDDTWWLKMPQLQCMCVTADDYTASADYAVRQLFSVTTLKQRKSCRVIFLQDLSIDSALLADLMSAVRRVAVSSYDQLINTMVAAGTIAPEYHRADLELAGDFEMGWIQDKDKMFRYRPLMNRVLPIHRLVKRAPTETFAPPYSRFKPKQIQDWGIERPPQAYPRLNLMVSFTTYDEIFGRIDDHYLIAIARTADLYLWRVLNIQHDPAIGVPKSRADILNSRYTVVGVRDFSPQ